MDINEIFKDLGMMIHEQGDVIGKPYMWNFMRWKQAICSFPVVASQARVTYLLFPLWVFLESKVPCLQQTKHHPWHYMKQINFWLLLVEVTNFMYLRSPKFNQGLLLLRSWKVPCSIMLAHSQDLWFLSYPQFNSHHTKASEKMSFHNVHTVFSSQVEGISSHLPKHSFS